MCWEYTSSRICSILQGSETKDIVLASNLESSKISLISFSKMLQFRFIVFIKDCRSLGVKAFSSDSRLVNPIIALSGIRISWLMLATKDCLSSAFAARSRATISSISRCLMCSMEEQSPYI